MYKPAVFLDRDGVINRSYVREGKPYAPRRLEDFEIFPNVFESLQALKQRGLMLIIVTNQPDVGNGIVEQSEVERMHQYLLKSINKLEYPIIDMIKVCYHSQSHGCDCRKPKPGMLLEAAEELKINLEQSIMIGDRTSDVLTGKAVRSRTVFIDYGYTETQIVDADYVVDSLEDFVKLYLPKL